MTHTVTKARILCSAKNLYIKNGFLDVTMEEIAKGSGLTRRTLYRYFGTKEELAFRVVIMILSELNSAQHKIAGNLHGTGIVRLESFLKQFIVYIGSRMDMLRFLGEFDFHFKDSNKKEPGADIMAEYRRVSLKPELLIRNIISQGLKDNSIHRNTDPELTTITISNVLWSFGQRIAIRNKHIKEETGIDPEKMIIHQVDLYINALKRGNK